MDRPERALNPFPHSLEHTGEKLERLMPRPVVARRGGHGDSWTSSGPTWRVWSTGAKPLRTNRGMLAGLGTHGMEEHGQWNRVSQAMDVFKAKPDGSRSQKTKKKKLAAFVILADTLNNCIYGKGSSKTA